MVKYVNKSIPFMSSGGRSREGGSEACLSQAGKPKCKSMSQACPGLDPGDPPEADKQEQHTGPSFRIS
jgi:hypothetical protein